MVLCPVCGKNETNQTHHLCYDPEVTIEICLDCHDKIHPYHGVGRPRGHRILKDKEELESIKWVPIVGKHTWRDATKEIPILKSRNTYGELHILRCPNAAKSPLCPEGEGNCSSISWLVLGEPSSKRLYLRCACGYDKEIKLE